MASRATIAELTLQVIERGNYHPTSSKKPVEISKQLQLAITNTVLYTPSQKPKLLKHARSRITFDSSIALLGSGPFLQQDRNVDLPENLGEAEAEDEDTSNTMEENTTEKAANTTTTTAAATTTTTTAVDTIDNSTTTISEDAKPTSKGAEPTTTTFEDDKPIPEPIKASPEPSKVTPEPTKLAEDGKREQKTYQTKFEVIHCTTLEATYGLAFDGDHPKTCLLNFASAKNPGGGFLGGAQAQEESIARSSGLYPCLTAQPKYYQENKRDPICVYTDHIIYSPNVPVFRLDNGDLLAIPYFPSIITAPAVNWGAALHRVRDPSELVRIMKERAAMILAIAVQHEEDTLVLGAWGCGVFRFPPAICAEIFYSLLVPPTAPFYSVFKHVVFAILDRNMVELFRRVFSEGPEILTEMVLKGENIVGRGGGRGGRGEGRRGGGGGGGRRGGGGGDRRGGNNSERGRGRGRGGSDRRGNGDK